MKCPKCHFENPRDSSFCNKCGTQIRTPDEVSVFPTETLQTPLKELTIGSTFARRYQVIEELGKGGMGKIYKALDTEIKEKVALKLIKPEIAADEKTIERFRNELRFARKISHKNVCRMYDLSHEEGTHYITMEYVEGEDLKSLIHRIGQLTVSKAVFITKQICEGLEEAHKLGVVHRDLKPQNIMIDKEGNARIMDFGIARSLKGKGITDAGVMIGTPEYMSPEQVEGKEVDYRADIYALGVILYEMLTIKVPFEGDTALSIALKHKTEMPKDPREINAQISEDLSRLVLKCLEKDKTKRYQSAEAVFSELTKIETGITPVSGVYRPKIISKTKKRKIALIAAVAILFLAAAATLFILIRSSRLNVNPKRIAVALFENKTGDPALDSIGSIAADWISQGISQTGLVEVVPAMAALESSRLVGSKEGGLQGLSQLRALARETGAGTVISGAYYLQGNNLQFQIKITDVQHGKLLFALPPVSGKQEAPMELIGLLRQHIMGALAMCFDPKFKTLPVSNPPIFEAYKELMIGIEFFGKDYAQAYLHFARSTELDPNYMLPKLYMAVGYGNQGQYAKAEEILRLINQNREQLSAFGCHLLDWYLASIQGNNDESLKYILLAEKLAPKNYNVNYIVGLDELQLNRPQDTVKTYAKLDSKELETYYTQSGAASWRFEVLAEAYHLLGNYKKELKVLREGQRYFPDNLWLLAYESCALAARGRIDEVKKVIEKSLTMASKEGTPGDVMLEAALESRAHGFMDEAKKMANQAVEWYQNRPSEEAAKEKHRYDLASALYTAERWQEAQDLFEVLASEKPDNIDYKGYLGALAARRGDRDKALRISTELKQINKPYLFGNHTYWRACIAALLGESEQAVNLIRGAFAQGLNFGVYLHRDQNLETLHNYKPFQELLRPKE